MSDRPTPKSIAPQVTHHVHYATETPIYPVFGPQPETESQRAVREAYERKRDHTQRILSKKEKARTKVPVKAVCAHCKAERIEMRRPGEDVKLYCELHRTEGSRCATPTKKRFTSKKQALGSAITRAIKGGVPLRTYHCGCGYWHLTSQTKYKIKI